MSYAEFYTELETRDAELEEARAKKAEDPEHWHEVATDYAEWRRAMRLLGGRPLGDPSMWPPDVAEFAHTHPDHPTGGAAVVVEEL